MQCESKKSPPPCGLQFSGIFDKRLRILKQFFKHPLYLPIYIRLQIFIQLSQTLTKLCHIKRDYLVTEYAQNVHYRPKHTRSDVCESC